MEVLTAARLAPVSLRKSPACSSEKRVEPRRLLPLKFPNLLTSAVETPTLLRGASRHLCGGLALLSSVLGGGGLARALTYEDALEQSVGIFTSFGGGSSDIDVGQVLDAVLRFVSENPLVVGGGAFVLAVPLILSQVLKTPKPWGVASAKSAYAKLSEDGDAQLLDIREVKDLKKVGSPDLRSLKKKAVSITYRGDDKPGFLKKLSLKFKKPGDTTLFILGKLDGNSELVAELVTANGFKAAFAIKGGAEGARGWVNSGLPWLQPKKSLNVDFGDLKDAISGALGGGTTDGLPVTLGLAVATGLGFLAFSEIETVLQLLGSAAIVQFVTKKLLFAEERKVTLQQLDDFLNKKIAPKELADEIKMIGKALLPASTNVKASLPASVGSSTDTTSSTQAEKVDDVPKVNPGLKVEATADPPQEINSVPQAEVSSDSISGVPGPLSPYPDYPDFKPPSSPCPSPP